MYATIMELWERRAIHETEHLEVAQEAFPDWDFIPVFGGWEAVPKGTEIIRGADIGSVVEKLMNRG